jgi:hypothetical protein
MADADDKPKQSNEVGGWKAQRADVKTLEKLADQIDRDALRGAGLNPSALFSIVEIIRRAIGAPLMWPSREAAAEAAQEYYRGDPALRHAFNTGAKWAVEQYHDLNIDQVKPR